VGRYHNRPSRSRRPKARRRGEIELKKGDRFAAFEQPALTTGWKGKTMTDGTSRANNLERVISPSQQK